MEALMQCIINQQLDQVPAVGETCEALVCPADASERRLGRALAETASTTQHKEDCLQYSPGLTGDDGKELSARSSVFLPCVSNSFLGAVQTTSATTGDTNNQDDGTTTSAGIRTVASIGWIAVAAFALL